MALPYTLPYTFPTAIPFTPPKPSGEKYTLFTLAATNAKPLEIFIGNIGNYQDMVAAGVDPKLWNVFDVRYLGDSFTGLFPPLETYQDGKDKLIAAINAWPGKFGLCGFSQGAGVCSMVHDEIVKPGGSLYHRKDDLIAGVMFGNPAREAGHTIPGGTDPGGHGMFGPDHRLSGSEDFWWDFANAGDPAACVGDLILDQVIQACSDALCFGDWTGHGDVIPFLQSIFSDKPPDWRSLIPNAVDLIQRLAIFSTEIFFWDPNLDLEPHSRYHFVYAGLPGNNSKSAVQLGIDYLNSIPPLTQPAFQYFPVSGDEDRFRFIVEEARTGKIIAKDLEVQKPKLLRALSGACDLQFDVDYRAYANAGIYFKPWAHWIHVEKKILGQRKIWASGIVTPSEIDKKSGIMHLVARGFSSYAKGTPWLENWNPLAVDPFEIVHKIWDHIQSYHDSNLGVTVYPATSGLEMLPGYAFSGELLNLDFFAVFIRASDKNDCGDYIDSLARDIPFDYVEQSSWNSDKSAIDRKIYLGYPIAGVQQDNLAFVVNENVIEVSPHTETEIDWASDVIIDGWFPGTEVSAQLTNSDPTRYRRVISQDDARINSDERAAAWARRKLSRRQTPAHFDSIIVDMGHPNAPFGTYDVGDRILVKGLMPWVGDISQLHKILAIAVDEGAGTCELTLRAEGAYEYDPIYYQGSVSGSVTMTIPEMPTPVVVMDAPTIG